MRFRFLIFLIISYSAFGVDHIQDPKNILKVVDKFLERPNFSKAFKCGQTLHYEMNKCALFCEPFKCEEVCNKDLKEYVVQVRNCSKESVDFFLVKAKKIAFRLTKENYDKFNFIRYFFQVPLTGKPLKKDSKIVIKSYKYEDFKTVDKTYKSIRVYFDYYHYDKKLNEHFKSPQSLVFGKQVETIGWHLDHGFDRLSRPVAKVLKIHTP